MSRNDNLAFGWLDSLVAQILGLGVLYYLFGRIGLMTSIPPGLATAVWPAAGIGLSALLIMGYRVWPGVFLGAFAINLPALFHTGLAKSSLAPLGSALGMAGGATIHAVLGAYLIHALVSSRSPFQRTSDIFRFLVAEFLATATSATLGTTFITLGGFNSISSPFETWVTWWTGDLVGALVITPIVFLLVSPEERLIFNARKKIEAVLLFAIFSTFCVVVFGAPGIATSTFPHPFILTPFFLWAAYRFSGWGALSAGLVMTAFAVISTRYPGQGPFAASGIDHAILFSQIAVAVHILVGLIVAAEAFQRRKRERELRISAVEFVSDIVANVDLKGRFTWINPAFELITGFDRKDWVGQRVARLVKKEDLAIVADNINRVLRGEKNPVVIECKVCAKDGSILVLESTVKLTRKSEFSGGRSSLNIVSRDITQLKRSRADLERQVELRTSELSDTEARLSAIFEQSPCGIAQVDLIGNFIFVTDQFCKIVGWSREELLRMRAHDLTHPDDLDLNVREFEACISQGTPYCIEKRYLRRDGAVVWVNNTVSALRNSNGTPTSVVAVCEDLTFLKRAQAEVNEKENRFQNIVDTSPIMMCTSEVNGDVFFNKAWNDFQEQSERSDSRESWLAGVHPEDADTTRAVYQRAIRTRNSYQMEYRLRRHDREYRWILESGTPRYLADGTYLGLMGSALDITGRKLAEMELKRAMQALETQTNELLKSNDELARFAYVASHDLKEPLRVVTMYLQLLKKLHEGKLEAGAEQYIQNAVEGAKRMYSLIDDLLAFSKIGLPGNKKETKETDLNQLIIEVLANLNSAVIESGAEITVELLPKVMSDRAEVAQVFQNLISNAIKYAGKIRPKITVGSKRSASGKISYFVRDNGIGIEERYFDKIFVLFQRLHSPEAYPGTGIGLAVCKKIVEQNGGQIWVESEPGKGSTFHFTLPGPKRSSVIPLPNLARRETQREANL